MNADTSTFAATDETTGPVEPMPTGRSACVIGSGFGGLALAIRLQSAGIQTTVVEARDKPGGRAYYWEREGFTFDAGPTVTSPPEDCGCTTIGPEFDPSILIALGFVVLGMRRRRR